MLNASRHESLDLTTLRVASAHGSHHLRLLLLEEEVLLHLLLHRVLLLLKMPSSRFSFSRAEIQSNVARIAARWRDLSIATSVAPAEPVDNELRHVPTASTQRARLNISMAAARGTKMRARCAPIEIKLCVRRVTRQSTHRKNDGRRVGDDIMSRIALVEVPSYVVESTTVVVCGMGSIAAASAKPPPVARAIPIYAATMAGCSKCPCPVAPSIVVGTSTAKNAMAYGGAKKTAAPGFPTNLFKATNDMDVTRAAMNGMNIPTSQGRQRRPPRRYAKYVNAADCTVMMGTPMHTAHADATTSPALGCVTMNAPSGARSIPDKPCDPKMALMTTLSSRASSAHNKDAREAEDVLEEACD